jgi:ligand-binding sensor domain-containing protein
VIRKTLILAFIVICFPFLIWGQDHSYAHYDVRDGLAGSTVYSMIQDKDGFIWFATETGLSRFDGTHFRNFTTADGLPDNEIISLYVDSKNRVWIMPFKNSVAYYWKGKIHNQQNDSLLRQLKITTEVHSILENREGDILIFEVKAFHIIDTSGRITTINRFESRSFRGDMVGLDSNGEFRAMFLIFRGLAFCSFDHSGSHQIKLQKTPYSEGFSLFSCLFLSPSLEIFCNKDSVHFYFPRKNNSFVFPTPNGFLNTSRINDSSVAVNTYNGAFLININRRKITDSFMKGQTVNAVMEDSEGNLWFSIMGKGVYRSGSSGFVNYEFRLQNNPLPVFCIKKFDSTIYIGTDHYLLWTIGPDGNNIRKRIFQQSRTRGRIITMLSRGKKGMVLGTDDGLLILRDWKEKSVRNELPIKWVVSENDSEMLVCSGLQATVVRSDNLELVDTILNYRSTCGYKMDGVYFIGTLDGLYTIDRNKKVTSLGDHYIALKSRITAIDKAPDGVLWIATNGNGLVGYKDGKVIANIRENDGLTSNMCRNIFISGADIWVGTDKGLNRITRLNNTYSIVSFTNLDGLNSDIINTVYVEGTNVFAGTAEGMTTFDANKIARRSGCRLQITGITIADGEWAFDTTNFIVPHKDHDIQFDFVGISYKSAGNITYRYRLNGLDDKWKTTTRTSLSYIALASGTYELQLQAVNKFGVHSRLEHIDFVIDKVLWERTWFRIAVLFVLACLVWFVFTLRVKMIRKKEEEKSGTIAKMAELEQMALRSQMNPHFIFNSLNSIQQYVMDKDVLGVNEFITNFSRLIRQTLDLSSRPRISLQEEIVYISTYLELEKRRFEDKFDYEIIMAKEINGQDYHIPPMILQPYVENAIRHGIGLRKDNKGKIRVKMALSGDHLVCIIEDNGVGRKLAGQFRGKNAIEYQSQGMSLTAKRIEMFNQTNKSPVLITIEDLEDLGNAPAGTRITLCFPFEDTKANL